MRKETRRWSINGQIIYTWTILPTSSRPIQFAMEHHPVYILIHTYVYIYLRAAAPAADPGKESGIAGETGKPRDEKFWQMHHHMQDHARRAMCVTGAAFGSIAVRCWLHDETVELEAYSEPNNTSMCIWAKRHKTKLPKAIMTRKLQLSWCYKIATQLFFGLKLF